MTSVSLIYNPYSLKSRILIAERELDAPENRIVEFMNRESFYDLLRPFRRRYVVWDGLLPELLEEINDPEAEITFIGREADFEAVRAAFEESRPQVEEHGYGNSWKLYSQIEYERSNMYERLEDAAQSLLELCETAEEQQALQHLVGASAQPDIPDFGAGILEQIDFHLKKWKESTSAYKNSKIGQLLLLKEEVSGICGSLGL